MTTIAPFPFPHQPNQGGLASIQKALQPLNQATRKLPMHLALLMARQRQQMPPNIDDPMNPMQPPGMDQPQIPKDLLTGEPPVLDPVGPPNDIFPPPQPPGGGGMQPYPMPGFPPPQSPGSPFPSGTPFQRPPWSGIDTTMPTFPGQLNSDKLKDFLGSLDMFNRSGGMPQPVAGLPSIFQ